MRTVHRRLGKYKKNTKNTLFSTFFFKPIHRLAGKQGRLAEENSFKSKTFFRKFNFESFITKR